MPKEGFRMSVVEKLEEAINDFPRLVADPTNNELMVVEWQNRIKREFVAFKKACVIVPRKILEELFDSFPDWVAYNDDDYDVEKWFKKLYKLLGVEKTK